MAKDASPKKNRGIVGGRDETVGGMKVRAVDQRKCVVSGPMHDNAPAVRARPRIRDLIDMST